MTSDTITPQPLTLPFDITLPMPGSKSHSNRAVVLAGLSPGETIIEYANTCDDVRLMVQAMQQLGWDMEWTDEAAGTLRVQGGLPSGNPDNQATLFCGNAGTAVRFLTAVACLVPGQWTITGDEHMQQRPIGDLVNALKELGATIEDTNGCPPIHITGGSITGGTTHLDASRSSQFLTALLQIGPLLPEGLQIEITSELTSPPYIALTKRTMSDFGVRIECPNDNAQSETRNQKPEQFLVPGTQQYQAVPKYSIEGDWSAAGNFLALAELTQSRLRCPNLSPDSEQGDREVPMIIQRLRQAGDHTIDCTNFPDQLMTLCVIAAHREGTTTFTGAANLRHKECDRLAVITSELSKLGVEISEHDDGVIVKGKASLQPATLDPCNDHRMAMCFGVIGSLFPDVTIQNPQCVSKTYPHFFTDLEKLQAAPRCIAIVGMRGCGKSNLARRLAKKLNLAHKDTDAVFEREAGTIGDFVRDHGWETFREGEEVAVAQCLKPGTVVALGGGAIESAKTRALLDTEATVVWMQSTPATIIERLKKTQRPALTDKPLEEEVPEIMARRQPLYETVADLVLPANTPHSKEVDHVISSLQQQCSW